MSLKKIIITINANKWIFLILALALVMRIIFLDRVPTAISFDELEYILNAKSFFLTGRDLTSTITLLDPLFFRYPLGILPQAELPYLLQFPIIGLTNLSLFSARITYALISVGTVVLIYLVGKELLSRRVGLVAAGIAAINPWLIFIGRTSYEVVPSMFFYLLALWILLRNKGWWILAAFPVFVLAFYSYIGTKVIFLPFILSSVFYVYIVVNKRKYLRQYIILCGLSFAFLLIFFLTLQFSEGSRLSDILTPFSPRISEEVDYIRKVSIETPMTSIFENKFTIYIRTIIIKLFDLISPTYLFATGDNFFSIFRHGLFYFVDLIFVFIGAFWLLRKNKKQFAFLLALFFIGTIPQVIHASGFGNSSTHITMIFPPIIIAIASGIVWTKDMISRFAWKKIGVIVLILAYVFSFLNFASIYFYQYPLGGRLDFPVRILSQYSTLSSKSQPVVILSSEQLGEFKKHLFYSNSLEFKSIDSIKKALRNNVPSLNNISFVSCDEEIVDQSTSVYIVDINCGNVGLQEDYKFIARLKDGGEEYRIYNDLLCSKYSLEPYPSNITLNDLAVEKLSVQNFCEVFINTR